MADKLNRLINKLSKESLATQVWLKKNGYYRQLVDKYVKSGWLTRYATGLYCRDPDKITWKSALHALQYQLDLPIHIGGKTALEVQGYSHFIKQSSEQKVSLYSNGALFLPAWFYKNFGSRVAVYQSKLFAPSNKPISNGCLDTQVDGLRLMVSIPERAIMELLSLVPQVETYTQSYLIMENLTTLRPSYAHAMLMVCKSYKVKRLFMHMAERVGHDWASEINLLDIDFGKGKRKIGEGGVFDSKYNISVPENLEPNSMEDIP